MISVIFVTQDAEHKLAHSLAALAPLAARGLLADAVVADLGSQDATLAVADAAGCTIIADCSQDDVAIARATAVARKAWLLGLAAGDSLDEPAAEAMRRHVIEAERNGERAAAALVARHRDGIAFRLLGYAPAHARRVLAPRAQAHLIGASGHWWRGARLAGVVNRVGSSE